MHVMSKKLPRAVSGGIPTFFCEDVFCESSFYELYVKCKVLTLVSYANVLVIVITVRR